MENLILLIILIPLVLLMFRSSRQRKTVAQMQQQLAPGAEVMTTAGLFGQVTAVEGDRVELEVAPGVHLWFLRQAVARVVEPATGDLEDDADQDLEDDVDEDLYVRDGEVVATEGSTAADVAEPRPDGDERPSGPPRT